MVGQFSSISAEGRDVFAYFKHEETPEGALYAVDLLHSAHAPIIGSMNYKDRTGKSLRFKDVEINLL